MDATPSTSGLCYPPKRRKLISLGHLSLNEKQSMINLYKQILTDQPKIKLTAAVSKIVTNGIAKSTVYRTIKEYFDIFPYFGTGTVVSPKHSGGRPGLVKTFDETSKNIIRRIVHGFFFKNDIPTLNKILNEIKKNTDLQNVSRSSLYKLMKEINFRYLKRSLRVF
ncbi:uncharacterized protein LOC130452887 isoform X2 [Diorhabda sublineata]|uniref:uncharacterized protein LOC130452887 isoform X2 n=1 Tax=Diorhabda sublineata TaxID=1163346 RepID=UPI0024E0442A|nr:uncharacterized protein LOC130452887 isoform X2 [Diorhabda sublineata]